MADDTGQGVLEFFNEGWKAKRAGIDRYSIIFQGTRMSSGHLTQWFLDFPE